MSVHIMRAARVKPGRTVLLIGLAAMVFSCDSAKAGGGKMASETQYRWKDLWQGSGPAWSPTGAPPGLTIVHSKAAWTRIITAFGPPNDKHVNLPVDWTKDVILFVQANEDNPATQVFLKSISGNGKEVKIAAALRASPDNQGTSEVEARPWIIASVPAAAFAANQTVKFSIDGRDLPVVHER